MALVIVYYASEFLGLTAQATACRRSAAGGLPQLSLMR
jgi:hypothetical protein